VNGFRDNQLRRKHRMPNYVRNIVKMKGIADLPLYNERPGEKYFDFQKLIPMPA
jgi:hypothetical protein